jgi:hydroxyacylglutathione hydrolase
MAVLRQRVIPVRSRFVNSFIIQGQSAILIDTGMPGFEGRILGRMEEKGIKWADVSLIIITHCHNDHFGCAAALKEKTDALVVAHRADAEALKTGVNPPLHPFGVKGAIMVGLSRIAQMPAIRPVEADILVDDELDLAKYGIAGRVITTPGHTPGSLSVFLEGGCVLVGDLMFGGFIRRKAPDFPPLGYDRQVIMNSIKKVLDLNPKIIYAGHGGPFTVDSVRRRFFG